MSDTDRPTILAIVSELLLRQKVVEGIAAAGFRPEVAGGKAVLADKLARTSPVAILVDLESSSVDPLAEIVFLKASSSTAGIPLLGFYGHVNTDIRDAARAAGCDRVATRGEVAMRLDRLLEELLAPAA